MHRMSRRKFLEQLGFVTVGGVLVSCASAPEAAKEAAPAAEEAAEGAAPAEEAAEGVAPAEEVAEAAPQPVG
jgi:hypothetical protein